MPLDTPPTPLSMAILVALGGEDLHGYALMQEIEDRSGGRLAPGTGSLYAALQRMMEDGWIIESPDRPRPDEDGRRRYYRITEAGRARVADEASRMKDLISDARAAGLLAPELGSVG